MADDALELLQGTLDTLVLKALSWEARHGYGIASWIRATTRDELSIDDGALYTALHRMHRRGWIAAEWGLSENNRKAKYYRLTPAGVQELRRASGRWQRYSTAVTRVLEAAS